MKRVTNTRCHNGPETTWLMSRHVGHCLHQRLFTYLRNEPRSEVAYRLRWARIMLRNAVRHQIQDMRDANLIP